MEQEPLVSIIIPVYKVEKFLDECVKSVVAQTYRNLEDLLVDDGSPDNCPAMCDAWAARDPRIRVIQQPNGGLSDARNSGIAVGYRRVHILRRFRRHRGAHVRGGLSERHARV